MPITRRQFDLGINNAIEEWMKRVIEFLSQRKEEAFNDDELWEIIYGKKAWQPREREALNFALIKLVEQDKIEKRIIQGIEYYCYKKALKKFIERASR